MREFIQSLPKAELHLHIEGSLEPQMLLDLAKRNNIKLKYNSIEEVKTAYKFNNLQEFLDIYYYGMSVLIVEQDFYDLTYAYLTKAKSENIVYAEIFFDPQAHINRGVSFATVINGVSRAMNDANTKLGMASNLIMCLLRDLSEKSAIDTLEVALQYRDKFIGIGLDSAEVGNPPQKFKNLYNMARDAGLKLVAHAGEEGPAEYIWQAIDILGVDRIDHGNTAITDIELVKRLAKDKIALTMCPLSNLSLNVVDDLKAHPAKKLLDAGVLVTVNSDDPAYFGGYINDNFIQLTDKLQLSKYDLTQLTENSLQASFYTNRV
jgi:adenosine deaminase